MITATVAYDICAQALESAREARAEAQARGDREGQLAAEDVLIKAQAALAEWRNCEALKCEVVPSAHVPGGYALRHRGRFVAHAPSLRAAEQRAHEEGYRIIDVTKCGYFA